MLKTFKNPPPNAQTGFMLMEVLLSVVLFLIGALAMLNLLAVSVADTAQSKYRNDASQLASNLINIIALDSANMANYDDSASPYAPKSAWANSVAAALPRVCAATCPNAQTNVSVNATTRNVVVTVKWRTPKENADHSYQTLSTISTN